MVRRRRHASPSIKYVTWKVFSVTPRQCSPAHFIAGKNGLSARAGLASGGTQGSLSEAQAEGGRRVSRRSPPRRRFSKPPTPLRFGWCPNMGLRAGVWLDGGRGERLVWRHMRTRLHLGLLPLVLLFLPLEALDQEIRQQEGLPRRGRLQPHRTGNFKFSGRTSSQERQNQRTDSEPGKRVNAGKRENQNLKYRR